MATDVTSLAYYASRAQFDGVAKENLATGGDYHELLPIKIDVPTAANLWNLMYGATNTLMPLGDIDLPQADYLDILDQLYSGVPFDQVKLTPTLAPSPPIQHEPYFPKYLATIPNDARTPAAVTATIGRLNEVLDGRAAMSSPSVSVPENEPS